MKQYILEGCVDSVESAILACRGGANRLELCSNLIIGGTTPSEWLFQEVKKYCNIKLHVLIRPRYGDFCYSEYEFNIMKEEVKRYRELGAEGIVLGILKADGTLDKDRMAQIIALANNMSITLSRAFDVCANPFDTMLQAKELGIHTILTSGQENSCLKGKELIAELHQRAVGEIDILVSGGVCSEVIKEIYQLTHVTSYHMSGKVIKESNMVYRKENVNMGLPSLSEYEIWQTDEQKIIDAKEVLDKICSFKNS
jgi:copper homeostasis protein